MSEPENNSPENNASTSDRDEEKKSENILKILDELLSHTNSSRRLFLIFIASALLFGPVAVILGGVLLGHPDYDIKHLESSQQGGESFSSIYHKPGVHIQIVDQNGTIIRELPISHIGDRSHTGPIFFGLKTFIIISIVFAIILLVIAIKEYRFFSHWNKRFNKYKSLKDKIDKELDDD
ncbi:MAG: hypothetical protein KGI02_01900 [Thaumarchaeota archaeon]|nr:hypothetical protein [Nitrososphaerota archaeon]MDE1831102.1 hypothetical protein [Nitrososphaerota archaeon]MDE1877295.1 hypothetical protein [Nitrososphaerota archaeon]